MSEALRALIQFYETGEDADRIAYDIAWVRDQESPVDTINGFVEVYMDPRGVKGAWEGIVSYVNETKTRDIQALAANAQWFEDRMPWDPRFRKPDVAGVTARAIEVIVETGDSGPLTAVGINLPNDQAIREKYGSKSVSLANVSEAYERSTPEAMRVEFSWSGGRGRPRQEMGRLRAGADDGHARSHRPWLGPDGAGRDGAAASTPAASSTRRSKKPVPISWRSTFCRTPSSWNWASSPATITMRSSRRSTEYYVRNALVQLRRVREGTHNRRGPHAQPPDDRQLVARAHVGGRSPAPRWQHLLRDGRRRPRFARASGVCSPRSSESRARATAAAARICSRPTACTSIRRSAMRSWCASIGCSCRPTPAS